MLSSRRILFATLLLSQILYPAPARGTGEYLMNATGFQASSGDADVMINGKMGTFATGSPGYYLKGMPSYNQRDPGLPASWFKDGDRDNSRLCGPTSAAMTVGAVYNSIPHFNGTWVATEFAGKTGVERIQLIARLAVTRDRDWSKPFPGSSTDELNNVLDLETNFPKARKLNAYASSTVIDGNFLAGLVASGGAPILNLSFYKESCPFPYDHCTYDETGSHFVAVNGYLLSYSNGLLYTRIHNPWGGWATPHTKASIEYYQIQLLRGGTNPADRPHGANTTILSRDGSKVTVINWAGTIDTQE